MISTKIDLQNKQLFADQVQGAGEREVARVTSLSLPYAGAWLTCAPIPALGLHMRGPEFVVVVKFRLDLVRFPNCIVYSWVYNTQKTVKFDFDCFHSLH